MGHKSNKRLEHYEPCTVCGRPAWETHEVYGGANRNKSIKFGAQVFICRDCHENQKTINQLRKEYQQIMMDAHGWTRDEFRAVFGKCWE